MRQEIWVREPLSIVFYPSLLKGQVPRKIFPLFSRKHRSMGKSSQSSGFFFFSFVYFFSDAIIDASRREGAGECLIIPANEERGGGVAVGKGGCKIKLLAGSPGCQGNGGWREIERHFRFPVRSILPRLKRASPPTSPFTVFGCRQTVSDNRFASFLNTHRLMIIHSFTRDHHHSFVYWWV